MAKTKKGTEEDNSVTKTSSSNYKNVLPNIKQTSKNSTSFRDLDLQTKHTSPELTQSIV